MTDKQMDITISEEECNLLFELVRGELAKYRELKDFGREFELMTELLIKLGVGN